MFILDSVAESWYQRLTSFGERCSYSVPQRIWNPFITLMVLSLRALNRVAYLFLVAVQNMFFQRLSPVYHYAQDCWVWADRRLKSGKAGLFWRAYVLCSVHAIMFFM